MPSYTALVEHRSRTGRDFPRSFTRLTFDAKTAAHAAYHAARLPSIEALGDLFVSVTIGRTGEPGWKA